MVCHPSIRFLIFTVAAASFIRAPLRAQQNCTFTFTPSSWNFPITGGVIQNSQHGVLITASNINCFRPGATTDSPWISLAGAIVDDKGNGLLGVAASSNTEGPPREGYIFVGSSKMRITQDGVQCNFRLSSDTSPLIPAGGGSGGFTVTPVQAKCGWTATSNNPEWIHLTSTPPPVGAGTLFYSVDPNPTASVRTGSITVGNRNFTITQDGGGCQVSVDPVSIAAPYDGQTGSLSVTASTQSCAWQAVSDASWVTVSGGTGSIAAYRVQANFSPNPRSANITIAGVRVPVTQDGQQCAITVSPGSLMLSPAKSTGNLIITAPSVCGWQADADVTWFTVTSAASGSGSKTIAYSVPANNTGQRRTGTLTVGGIAVGLTQGAADCGITTSPVSLNLPAAGGTSAITVNSEVCDWSASLSVPWIQISGVTQGAGNGTVNLSVAPNTTRSARSGIVQIGSAGIPVAQAGQDGPPSSCAVSLSSPATVALPAGSTVGTIKFTSSGCNWTLWTAAPWIQLPYVTQGTGDGSISFGVAPNASQAPRTAVINIGSSTVTVTQAGQTAPPVCPVTMTPPTSATVSSVGGGGVFSFTADASCSWTVSTAESWITLISANSGQGSGSIIFFTDANVSAPVRTGVIAVNGSLFTIKQAGTPLITKEGVTNAASFKSGPVAPGEIITIFGSGLGATPMATLQLTDDGGFVTTRLAGTLIVFDGVAAPMILSSDGQLNAAVPYEIAGQTSTQLQVWYQGSASNSVQLDVAPTAPAIFTQNASGTGPGAIRNQDYSVNTADNPAAPGSVVMIFATGEGVTLPYGVDGKVTLEEPFPMPFADVTVSIGSKDAKVTYAGSAPSLVAGVLQVNAVIPEGITPGAEVPIQIKVGDVTSPDGVTIAVK